MRLLGVCCHVVLTGRKDVPHGMLHLRGSHSDAGFETEEGAGIPSHIYKSHTRPVVSTFVKRSLLLLSGKQDVKKISSQKAL